MGTGVSGCVISSQPTSAHAHLLNGNKLKSTTAKSELAFSFREPAIKLKPGRWTKKRPERKGRRYPDCCGRLARDIPGQWTPAAASGPPGWRGRITVWLHLVEALSRAPLHHEYRLIFYFFFIASVVFVLCCAKSSDMIDNMGLFKWQHTERVWYSNKKGLWGLITHVYYEVPVGFL